MEDRIRSSKIWEKLSVNPKFKGEFEKCLKRYSYYANPKDLNIRLGDNKIIVSYNSKIENSDLGCQYKIFNQTEFILNNKNDLIIGVLTGRFESEKGHKFKTTTGGVINTYYSCNVYDIDGIELSYSRYDDKYNFDKIDYSFMKDFPSVILGAFNPNLATYSDSNDIYPVPKFIGKNSQFIRQMRTIDNLGIVEVTKYTLNKDVRVSNKEYYFNVLLTNQDIYTPELIHIISGEPFAIVDENNVMKICEQYNALGINKNNYQEIARERFLSELQERKHNLHYVDDVLAKYDIMIDKVSVNKKTKSKTR